MTTKLWQFATEIICDHLINYISNGKAMIILSTVGLIKKIWLNKMSYFPEPHILSKNKIENELDLSNYATKSNLKRYIRLC